VSEQIPLNLTEPGTPRRRAGVAVGVAVVLGAAIGGVVGLLAGRLSGVITAAVVVLGLLALTWISGRRRLWLEGSTLVAKTIGRKRVELRTAERLELVVTDVRGTRTIGLLISARGRTINLPVAIYSGTGGRELGILMLRRPPSARSTGWPRWPRPGGWPSGCAPTRSPGSLRAWTDSSAHHAGDRGQLLAQFLKLVLGFRQFLGDERADPVDAVQGALRGLQGRHQLLHGGGDARDGAQGLEGGGQHRGAGAQRGVHRPDRVAQQRDQEQLPAILR
jgi:hypothetical protein